MYAKCSRLCCGTVRLILRLGDVSTIRRYHKAMIARGLEAIEEQPINSRTVGCTTFTMDPKQTAEASAMLERFREEFRRAFHDEDGVEVCQLNYQFFWYTDLSAGPPKKMLNDDRSIHAV